MTVPRLKLADTDAAQAVARAADVLRAGGLVVLPTETVYATAGRLDLPAARKRLSALRDAASGPMTIHLAKPGDAEPFTGPLPAAAARTLAKMWPGPVGVLFSVAPERRPAIANAAGIDPADLFTADGITLRCPDEPFTRKVLENAGGPVACVRSPVGATSVSDPAGWGENPGVDLVVDAGPTRFGKPSTLVRLADDGTAAIVREGVYDQRILDRMTQTTVLFVCSGNTCRSPMAEAIARARLIARLGGDKGALDRRRITVISAGTFAYPGAPATRQAVDAVRAVGGELATHRSRPLSIELIHAADYIYAMGRGHASTVLAMVPGAAGKLNTLDPDGDIDDPIGGDLRVYQDLVGKLGPLIDKRLDETVLRSEAS